MKPTDDYRFNDMQRAGVPEDPWNQVVGGLWVGSSEVQYPRDEFDAVVSVFDWHYEREPWLPPKGTPHLVLPMLDDHNNLPPIDRLELASKFILHFHGGGGSVLVRCQAGLNRSSITAGYYMVKELHLTGVEVVETITALRDGALFNLGFQDYLLNLET